MNSQQIIVTTPQELREIVERSVSGVVEPLLGEIERLRDQMWMNKETLSHYEAARYCDLAPETVTKYCREGRLEGANKVGKMWFIPRRALDRFLAGKYETDGKPLPIPVPQAKDGGRKP